MFKVGLIGLGDIAAKYTKPGNLQAYCHAGGVELCEGVEITAVADDSKENMDYYSQTWGDVSSFASGEEMLDAAPLDIVAICTPAMTHKKLILKAMDAGVKVIFAEKPLATSLKDIDEINLHADKIGSLVVVSHTRRWGPQLQHMARLIHQEDLIGDLLSITTVCDGPVLTFAIHGIDMLCQFAGDADPVSVFGYTSEPKTESKSGLPEQPIIEGAIVKFNSGVTAYHRGQLGPYDGFVAEILGTKGLAKVGFGSEVQVYDEKNNLMETSELHLPPKVSPFKIAYQEIRDHLEGGGVPNCTRDQYMPVYELAFGLLESSISKREISLPCVNRNRLFYAYR
jgi:predicted dehydrogenase